jgi:molybdopterin converting factor small subunit
MKVRIRLIATLMQLLPAGTQGNMVEIDLPPGMTLADVLSRFDVPLDDSSVILLNGLTVDLETALSDGDTVSAFSAIAGG